MHAVEEEVECDANVVIRHFPARYGMNKLSRTMGMEWWGLLVDMEQAPMQAILNKRPDRQT